MLAWCQECLQVQIERLDLYMRENRRIGAHCPRGIEIRRAGPLQRSGEQHQGKASYQYGTRHDTDQQPDYNVQCVLDCEVYNRLVVVHNPSVRVSLQTQNSLLRPA